MTVSKAVVDVLAATPLQEGLLALHRLSSGADPYHVQFVFRIDGNLDEALLARCADAMLVRYPNLRVAFYDKNVEHPVQVVPASAKLDWEVVPMTATSAPDASTAMPRPQGSPRPTSASRSICPAPPHCG